MMYFCVCLTDITVLKIFPCLSFISSSNIFLYVAFLSCFYNIKLHGQSCDISFITIFSSFLKLCSTVACVLFDDVDDAVCCSMYMYHVCGLGLSQEKQLLSYKIGK